MRRKGRKGWEITTPVPQIPRMQQTRNTLGIDTINMVLSYEMYSLYLYHAIIV